MLKMDAESLSCVKVRVVMATLCTLLAGGLTGCGFGAASTQLSTQSVQLTGRVHGGQQPLVGSNIALFATASTGYGGSVSPLTTTTTNTAGDFQLTASFTCPAGQQLYLVAAGGNPGLTSGTNNSAVFLVAALGACPITAATVDINEVTTVAAAYALSGFAPVGGAGLTQAAVVAGTAMPGFTTSSTNTQGLGDAFLNANNIVNLATGTAYTATPTANSMGIVPQATIHALADILQPCVNSAAPVGTASNCPALFAAATPPTATGIAAPVNVFQAALDIAQFPGNNVGTLFGLINSTPAFVTSLTSAPNDWTIGITYTSSLLASPLGLGVNASDDIFVSGSTNADLIEFSPQGAGGTTNLLPTLSVTTDNLREITVDPTGNVWLSDGGKVEFGPVEYTAAGVLILPTASTTTGPNYNYATSNTNNYALAADKFGNIWISSYKKSTCSGTTGSSACTLYEYVDTSSTYTPVYQFGTGTFEVKSPADAGGARGLAVDSNTGNVWLTDIVSGNLTLFQTTLASGAVANVTVAASTIPLGTSASADTTNNYGSVAVAIDASSNAWAVVTGGPADSTTSALPAALYGVSSAGTVLSTANSLTDNGGLITPSFLTIDGRNNIFVSNTGASATTSAVVEYDPTAASGGSSTIGFLSPNLGFSPGATFTGGVLSGGTIYQSGSISIDRSGAIWVLSTGSGTSPSLANLVQILGVAAPTDPVLADGKYGVRP